jgi:hypothetical protein
VFLQTLNQGVRLRGQAQAGQRVSISLNVTSTQARRLGLRGTWLAKATSQADSRGEFSSKLVLSAPLRRQIARKHIRSFTVIVIAGQRTVTRKLTLR